MLLIDIDVIRERKDGDAEVAEGAKGDGLPTTGRDDRTNAAVVYHLFTKLTGSCGKNWFWSP